MTYKERVAIECPNAIDPTCMGGVKLCPANYVFLDSSRCGATCAGASPRNCKNCWNTEMPEQKKTEPKKAETPMDLIEKALETNDKSVHIRVEPDGAVSVDIVPVGAFKEEEDEEPVSELGLLNEQEARETIRFLQSKFELKPEHNYEYWRKIEYGKDKNGKRIIVKNEPPEYMIVNVYCSQKDRVLAAAWSRLKGGWIVAGWTDITDDPTKSALKSEVTHWMPVPNAPKGE